MDCPIFVKDFLRKVHKFSRKGRNPYSSCITLLKNWTFRGKSRYEIVFGMQPRNCELLQSLQVVVQWKIMFWDQGGFSEGVNDVGSWHKTLPAAKKAFTCSTSPVPPLK